MRAHIYIALAIVMSLCKIDAYSSETKAVAQFNLNNYEGWTYTRSGSSGELNRDNISRLKINLFGSYTLVSPTLDCSGLDSIKVKVVYATGTTQYVASKLALTYSLTTSSGAEYSTTVAAKPSLVQQDMVAMLPVLGNEMVLQLSALKADIDNHAAVRSVDITGYYSPVVGDINGDGGIDVADVNTLVNAIIGAVPTANCDVNSDGVIDVSDVNSLINIILGD